MADTKSPRVSPSRNLRLRTGIRSWALASHARPTQPVKGKKGKK